MIDLDNIKNITFDTSPENISNAIKVYTVGDLIGLADNLRSLDINDVKTKIYDFANSSLAKATPEIEKQINGLKSAITTLDVVEKTVEIYRVAKPLVKLAVNLGGVWLNFANVGEIAQDVLQLAFRFTLEEGRKLLDKFLEQILNMPILLSLGDGDASTVITEIGRLDGEISKALANMLSNLSLSDYLSLVRTANKNITKRKEKGVGSYQYIKKYLSFFNDIVEDENFIYTINESRVVSKNKETQATGVVVEAENIKGFFPLNQDKYLSVEESGVIKIKKNDTEIGAISGDFIKFTEYEGEVIAVSSEEIKVSDNLDTLFQGNITDAIAKKDGIYVSTKEKIYFFENGVSPFKKILEISEGEINSIEILENIFYSYTIRDTSFIYKLTQEKEFEEKYFPESNFSFYKKASDGNTYAFKNESLAEIKYDSGNLIYETLTTKIPGDASDIDTIEINGNKYFLAPIGESIFVARDGYLNSWEEKFIDFEELGIINGMITSIKVDNNSVYLSSLNRLLKVNDINSLISEPPNLFTDILDWDSVDMPPGSYPEPSSEEVFVGKVDIDKSSIKEFDRIIYKIFNKDIISAGNKVLNGENEELSLFKNIYNLHIKDGIYYTSQGREVYENESPLSGLEVNGNILGISDIDGKLIIFSEENYYEETGFNSYNKKIESPFTMKGKCKLLSDGKTIIAHDRNRVFNISNNKKVIELIQFSDKEIDKIRNLENESLLFLNDEVRYIPLKEVMVVDEKYNNGYGIYSHYEKGLGIAPFDLRTNTITKTLINKEEYTTGMSGEFEDHFVKLMEEIPIAVIEKIKKEILDEILSAGAYEEGKEEIKKFIVDYLTTKTITLLSELMRINFGLSMEKSNDFVNTLLARLKIREVNNVTDEFYFIAMEFVKEALEQTIYDYNSLDIWMLVWEYYNRHKYEWGRNITSKIDKSYVNLRYSNIIDETIDVEIKESYDYLVNTTIKEEIDTFSSGKSGEISSGDKETLRGFVSNSNIPRMEEMTSFTSWVDSITEASGTFYKPTQQHQYEDIIDNSSMSPIQWNELPELINRETFSRLLNMLLDRVKEEMKKGIYLLIENDGVPCFSCVNASEVYKGVKSEIESLLTIAKALLLKKVSGFTTFEEIPNTFYIPNIVSSSESLKKILDKQTDIYKSYIIPFINAVIEASEEAYDEEINV